MCLKSNARKSLLISINYYGTREINTLIRSVIEYGNPDREIDVIAGRLRADLIIVSVHHGKWLEHLLFGRRVDWILAIFGTTLGALMK